MIVAPGAARSASSTAREEAIPISAVAPEVWMAALRGTERIRRRLSTIFVDGQEKR